MKGEKVNMVGYFSEFNLCVWKSGAASSCDWRAVMNSFLFEGFDYKLIY